MERIWGTHYEGSLVIIKEGAEGRRVQIEKGRIMYVGKEGVGQRTGNMKRMRMDVKSDFECKGNGNREIEGWMRERSILFGSCLGSF